MNKAELIRDLLKEAATSNQKQNAKVFTKFFKDAGIGISKQKHTINANNRWGVELFFPFWNKHSASKDNFAELIESLKRMPQVTKASFKSGWFIIETNLAY